MTTFLLIPGAGLGDRFDDADPSTDLHDHVDDVIAAVGDRHGVVLLGHSYAASVVWEAMPRLDGHVGHVMLLGAVPPPVGTSAFDQLPPEGQEQVAALARDVGDGWRVPPFTRELLDVVWGDHGFDDASFARYQQVATGHPLATMQTPVTVPVDAQVAARQTHITCLGDPYPAPQLPAPWERAELDTGHWPMLTAPKSLVDLLDGLVSS